MNHISLNSKITSDITVISNVFIDKYMPVANGAYVKVYLYLLRCYQSNNMATSITNIADHLDHTENDILRALLYWEKFRLISLEYDHRNNINSIILNSIDDSSCNSETSATTSMNLSNIKESDNIITFPNSNNIENKNSEDNMNEPLQGAMNIIELYLNRPLKPMDIELILYLYHELHFSPDLIMYLYEYCVSKGKITKSYIETVAINWAKKGVDSEEKAKAISIDFEEGINVVNKAFALNRSFGKIERDFINKWFSTYNFSADIVEEACNRALLRTSKPDFNYAGGILDTWHKKGVKTLKDIERIDQEFNNDKFKKVNSNKSVPRSQNTNNKFNQFPQRNYSDEDYALLEQKLLNKGL